METSEGITRKPVTKSDPLLTNRRDDERLQLGVRLKNYLRTNPSSSKIITAIKYVMSSR